MGRAALLSKNLERARKRIRFDRDDHEEWPSSGERLAGGFGRGDGCG
jgi:hypothetical protein